MSEQMIWCGICMATEADRDKHRAAVTQIGGTMVCKGHVPALVRITGMKPLLDHVDLDQ